MKNKYWEILKEAQEIAEQREEQYGDVVDNFKNIQIILERMFDTQLDLATIAEIMIATKISREGFQSNKDNMIDLINYIAIRQHIIDNNF